MQVSISTSTKQPIRCRKPSKPTASTIVSPVTLACRLDRNADLLLFLGCHVAAERLALRAQALREVRQ